ncbi:MAG: DUF1846 family protein [Clostridiales bacterium]|nr:DUF1846 family protein [Clostridiales bacterium]
MSTCLSQIYNDSKRGILSGFAKLELFPIWNLGKESFVNLAYEAATVNIDDKVIEDTFYNEKHGKNATSYNRDMQLFPVLNNILKKIYNTEIYSSPTEMGVNFAKDAIIDEEFAEYSGKREIIRRYLKEKYEYIYNGEKKENYLKIKKIMNEYDIKIEDDIMIKTINLEKEEIGYEIAGIEFKDGTVIMGKEKEDITKTAGLILNLLKIGTDIPKQEYLIPKEYIKKVFELKEKISEEKYVDITECLIILTILSNKSEKIQKIMGNLEKLKNLRYYSTSIIPEKERVFLKSLNIDILYNM